MKKYGYVKYPDASITDAAGSWMSQGKVLFGWNRGKLHTNHNTLIFEDTSGIVHVVHKDLFFIPKEKE